MPVLPHTGPGNHRRTAVAPRGRLAGSGPLVAAAISFVAFQGWQLLFYDQESIADPADTIRTAVYVAIPVAVAIYVLVAVVTVNLAPEALASHPHVALKDAAARLLSPYGLSAVGAVALSLSALFSTGSAINATLFSSAFFAKGMLADDLLPDNLGDADADADGIPTRTLVVIGAATAIFSALGSLRAITSFASLSFIVVFGAVSYLALRQRDRADVRTLPPVVGVLGTAAFLPLMLWNLHARRPGTFYAVVAIAVLVVGVELLYFERAYLEREVEQLEGFVPGVDPEE
jgi:amino acid transporter